MEERLAKLEKKGKTNNSSSAVIDEEEMGLDYSKVNLLQNVPNHFGTQTEIAFTIAENTKEANLYIYDLQGTQIKSYPINQRGSGSITIRGNELKAGMYMYSLVVDGVIVGTEKMILTR